MHKAGSMMVLLSTEILIHMFYFFLKKNQLVCIALINFTASLE